MQGTAPVERPPIQSAMCYLDLKMRVCVSNGTEIQLKNVTLLSFHFHRR